MSEDEESGTVKRKTVDVNINVSKGEAKKKEITSEDAEQVAKELSGFLRSTVEPATTVSEYKRQKNQIRVFLAEEMGKARERRSRKEAHERTSFGTTASGQARLSAKQAMGEDFQGVTGDLKRMEFNSYEDMIQTLRELEKQGDKEATKYLGQLYKKAIKEGGRKHMKATFVGKVTDLLKEPNPKSHDEIAKEEVKEKVEAEKSKWKEEED